MDITRQQFRDMAYFDSLPQAPGATGNIKQATEVAAGEDTGIGGLSDVNAAERIDERVGSGDHPPHRDVPAGDELPAAEIADDRVQTVP